MHGAVSGGHLAVQTVAEEAWQVRLAHLMKSPEMLEVTARVLYRHHATFYNLGLCQVKLGKHKKAMVCMRRAIEEKSDYQRPKQWLAKLVHEQLATPQRA